MRYLESARLDRFSKQEKDMLVIGDTPVEKYAIPWSRFDEAIDRSKSVNDIAVNIAIKAAKELMNHGLSDRQVVEMIIRGYDPKGPIKEHGNIPQIHQLWDSILDKIQQDEGLEHLAGQLTVRAIEEFGKCNVDFRGNSQGNVTN